ncbi:MAG: YceI family protein [Bacteroidota bacterium]|nr:YceI family protein [Bacteroidota bacterium]
MRKIDPLAYAIIVLLASAFTLVKPISWKIKPNYSVKIVGAFEDKMYFKTFSAMILFDEEALEKSKIMATVDAKSLTSPSAKMTEHAKQALEIIKYPEVTFMSTSIAKTKLGYEAVGDLTLKGITKKIKFPFVFNGKKDLSEHFPFVPKETFSGKIILASKDFNVARKGTPDQIIIDLTIPVSK